MRGVACVGKLRIEVECMDCLVVDAADCVAVDE